MDSDLECKCTHRLGDNQECRRHRAERLDFWLAYAWVLYFAIPLGCLVIVLLKSV